MNDLLNSLKDTIMSYTSIFLGIGITAVVMMSGFKIIIFLFETIDKFNTRSKNDK